MVRSGDFDKSVALPPGLTVAAIRNSIDYVEREAADLVEIYLEQANVFSAIVGILGTKALDATSVYEKSRHANLAQQRFPDLCKRGAGPCPSPRDCLESKASKRAWAVQSHYDHEGWYIIWRYLVDPSMMVEPDKPVIVWRVDVLYLTKEDWKYERSSAGEAGGGRTHTFSVRNPAKRLVSCGVYKRSDIRIANGKPIYCNGA